MRKWAPRGRDTAERVGLGVLTAILVGLAGLLWHRTEWGEGLDHYVTEFFQHILKGSRSVDDVLVIDINQWPLVPPKLTADTPPNGKRARSAAPTTSADATKGITNRVALRQLLQELAKVSPPAIGIDVDFSPDDNGYVSPLEDPNFFAFCRCLAGPDGVRVPVFLGVGRQALSPSFRWLGEHKYWDLAAGIMMPAYTSLVPQSVRHSRDESRAPERAADQPQYHESASQCEDKRTVAVEPEREFELPSLSFALASAADQRVPKWLQWHFAGTERSKEKGVPGAEDYTVSEVWLDNNLVSLARQRTVPAGNPDATPMLSSFVLKQARHKVVLIGDSNVGSEDVFSVIETKEPQAAGMYVHAAAVQTLLDKPFTSITDWGTAAIDFALTICGIVLVVRVGATKEIHFANLVKWALVGGVFGCAVLMVGLFRVLWIDFPIVIAGALAHEKVEVFLKRVYSGVRVSLQPQRSRGLKG
jgi:hypothetical protein